MFISLLLAKKIVNLFGVAIVYFQCVNIEELLYLEISENGLLYIFQDFLPKSCQGRALNKKK